MSRSRLVLSVVLITLVIGGLSQSQKLINAFRPAGVAEPDNGDQPVALVQEPKTLKMTEQARKNLGLISRPVKPQVYWRTIEVPGEIVDRPGYSDRGVTSPAVGVVTEVHAFPATP